MKTKITLFTIILAMIGLSNFANAQWVHTTGITNVNGVSTSFISDGTNIYAGTARKTSGNGGGGVFVSTDNGSSWTQSNTGLTNLNVLSLAISGVNIFAGTDQGGVFLSTNSGGSWTKVNTGLTDSVVNALAINGNNIYAGTKNNGVFVSSNNGTSWVALGQTGMTNHYVYSLAITGSAIIAGTGNGVCVSTDNGTNWTLTSLIGTAHQVTTLALSGTTIFAGCTGSPGPGVFYSNDNGVTWAATGLTAGNIPSLAANSTSVFAATSGQYVKLSTDNGVTWTTPSHSPMDYITSSVAIIGTNVFAGDDTYNGLVWKRPLSEMVTGIESPITHSGVEVYPNPSSGKFIINSQITKGEVSVYNGLGENIYQSSLSSLQFTLDISSKPRGIYFVKISDGEKIYLNKIIVQ